MYLKNEEKRKSHFSFFVSENSMDGIIQSFLNNGF